MMYCDEAGVTWEVNPDTGESRPVITDEEGSEMEVEEEIVEDAPDDLSVARELVRNEVS